MKFISTLQKIIRKLLTRPIYELNRRRKYSIRERIMSLPPLLISAEQNTSVLLIVTASGYIFDACWAAYSLLPKLPKGVMLHIVVDGELTPKQTESVRRLFNGVCISSGTDFVKQIPLKYPNVVNMCENHPLGPKFATVMMINQISDLIYSDSDVLCFGDLPELNSVIRNRSTNLYMSDVSDTMIEPTIVKRAKEKGFVRLEKFNSGFIFVKQNALSMDIAETILESSMKDPDFDISSWMVEQTVLSFLMGSAGAATLPSERYILNVEGQFYFHEYLLFRFFN